MPKDIQFSEVDPRYVFERDCLAFLVRVDGKTIECLVTLELLITHFGAREPSEARKPSEEAMRQAYEAHKAEIQAIARSHIENGWIDEKDRVFLTTRFTRLTVKFGDRLLENPDIRTAAESAQRILTEIIGPNAEEVAVEWDMDERPQKVIWLILRIIDPTIPISEMVGIHPKGWHDVTALSLILGGTWGNVLRARSRKLILKSG